MRTRRPARRVGATITASDDNSLTLTYSLAGEDADLVRHHEGSTGQIRTKAALNNEAKGTYAVFMVTPTMTATTCTT